MSLGRTFTLPTGAKIPAVGFGTFASEGSKGESYKAVTTALEAGYRYTHFLEKSICADTDIKRVDISTAHGFIRMKMKLVMQSRIS